MSKTARFILLAAVTALALPASAGSWPPTPARKAYKAQGPAAAPRAIPDFEFIGGEGGWQLSQHKYDFVAGKVVMSDECDHAIRVVKAPTLKEVEETRALYPG